MAESEFLDIWRKQNPTLKKDTWSRQSPNEIKCRLAFFRVSEGLSWQVSQSSIEPGYKSDHDIITLQINFDVELRGSGFFGNQN